MRYSAYYGVKQTLFCFLLLIAAPAFAAKIHVTWVNPTRNTDGTPLTDLAAIKIEWGSCNGVNFGTLQSSISVAPGPQASAVYPSGLSTVCVRAYAINSKGVSSAPTGVVSKKLFDALGRPVTLGQPITLP